MMNPEVVSCLSVRQWFTLTMLCVINFVSSITTSLQAPFYPDEAEQKGATASEYGLVFGIYSLVSFLACPIYGKYMDVLGVKIVLNSGLIVSAFSAMIFGLLIYIESHVVFISLSFVVRIVGSLGTSAAITASFTIATSDFPGSVATAIATVYIFFGLGNIMGPGVGGYLFSLGGFSFPFMMVGGFLITIESLIFFTMPEVEEDFKRRQPGSILSFLKVLPVALDVFSTIAVSMGYGFYVATLEPHIRQFKLTSSQTGAVFVCIGATYSLTATLVGRLCDTRVYPKLIIVFGCVLSLVSFLLVGPMPYVNIHPQMWMVCLGLVLQGLGLACILVSAFIDSIRSAVESGLPDDFTSYAMVSGIMTSSFALGSFIGPSLAGVLFDAFGFRVETLFMIGLHSIVLISITWYIYTERQAEKVEKVCPLSSEEQISDEGAVKEGAENVVTTTIVTQGPDKFLLLPSIDKRKINNKPFTFGW